VPGIFFPRGAQLRIPAGRLTIRVTDDGRFEGDPLIPQLRMDMWPQWLHEALDATVAARDAHAQVTAEAASPTDEVRLGDLLDLELRASMRAITSAAFAVDAFYASVRARSSEHPDRARWLASGRRRAPRHVQVFATLHHALKIRRPGAGEVRRRIKELFKYRGWAVHADSAFRDPVLREDIDRGIDWHYAAFRAENAVSILGMTVQTLDVLVGLFERGTEELREWAPFARERLDEILDLYDAQEGLTPFTRVRDAHKDFESPSRPDE
jgi:hypothetical protein